MAWVSLFFLLSLNAFAIDWQGHRGARGLYPENTIGSMVEALKYPVKTLELDVVVSKNLDVVVSHEPWMNEEICLAPDRKEIRGKKFNIYKMTYEEIQKFDCGSLPHKRFPEQKKINVGKPLLSSLIDSIEPKLKDMNRSDVVYNIEIKSTPDDERDGFQPDVKTFSDTVVKVILSKLPVEKFTIQSFDWRVLQYIHKTYPEIRLVALLEDKMSPSEVLKLLGFKPSVFSPYFKSLEKSYVEKYHSLGIKVIPWTVNDVSDMKKMIEMGVDGIITDYPDRIGLATLTKCKDKESWFEGRCVKIPAHAVASSQVPGWDCKPGYVQKRMKCRKILVPKNGRLTPDGKSWECLEGFKRYRDKCVK